jgi:hypothetical protein
MRRGQLTTPHRHRRRATGRGKDSRRMRYDQAAALLGIVLAVSAAQALPLSSRIQARASKRHIGRRRYQHQLRLMRPKCRQTRKPRQWTRLTSRNGHRGELGCFRYGREKYYWMVFLLRASRASLGNGSYGPKSFCLTNIITTCFVHFKVFLFLGT